MDNLGLKAENIVAKSNFLFCHFVFKKPSAAGVSESIYMSEMFNNVLREKREFEEVLDNCFDTEM